MVSKCYLELGRLMAFHTKEELALRIRQVSISASQANRLRVNFAKGRRQSDILLIKLSGEREHAHTMFNRLVVTFPEIDIELLKIKPRNTFYAFILIATQKLDEQNLAFNERRSNLIAKFPKLAKSLKYKLPPPDFNDAIFPENL